MADMEQLDSILHWIHAMHPGDSSFLDDPLLLLDCVALAGVYNSVSDDRIDPQSLKRTADGSWVNILLNLRAVAARISPLLRDSGVELSVDMSAIARKKDRSELLKFLRCFLLYALRAPQRRCAIDAVRALDAAQQAIIQRAIEEAAGGGGSVSGAEQRSGGAARAESGAEREAALREDVRRLRARAAEIEAAADAAARQSSDASERSAVRERALRAKYDAAEERQRALCGDAERVRGELRALSDAVAALRERQRALSDAVQSGQRGDATAQQMEAKLLILRERCSGDRSGAEEALSALRNEVTELRRKRTVKEAELSAMRATLAQSTESAERALLRRVAQLNAQMEETPLGKAKQAALRMRRYCDKLSRGIRRAEREGGDKEHRELEREIQKMVERKTEESDMLAKKLSFLQATLEQSEAKIQRMKLNVALQTHTNRLRRYRNCFIMNE